MATPPPPQQGPHSWQQQPPAWHAGPYVPHRPPGPYARLTPEEGAYGCRVCGALPVAETTVHGHQGMIVLMRFLSRKGPFCRDCGLAVVRDMSAKTLWQGWWGPLSVFITPVTLLTNLGPWGRLRRLGPPVGGAMPPLDPGRPLWRRPVALAGLVPLLAVILAFPALILIGLLAGDDAGPRKLSVGTCVQDSDRFRTETLVVEGCDSALARYRVTKRLDTPGSTCAAGELISVSERSPQAAPLCLAPWR
ncbi:hypothetical protein ACFCZ1_24755 [Streptomyces sp. NPDC056224]|uniref:LppU/SCO3897 family protein n=1 Tax=Streptomyces sp. NPDC056224 TaxID=3345750 RepID=UPI0035DBCA2A